MIRYILILFTFLTILSCSNPTENEEPYFFVGNENPVINGIIRTNSDSPTPIGLIGVPNEKGKSEELPSNLGSNTSIPIYTQLSAPYPNPFNGRTTISFQLNIKAFVKCWVTKGKTSNQDIAQKILYSAMYGVNTNSYNNNSILLYEYKMPGAYQLEFDARSFSDGVYRVYLQIGDKLLWRNLLILYNNQF